MKYSFRMSLVRGAIMLAIFMPRQVKAAIYGFNRIAEAGASYPAINNSGTVAFVGELTATHVSGAYTGNGGPVTTIAAPVLFTAARVVSINVAGQVAFYGNTSFTGFSAYRGSGGSLAPIASGSLGALPGIADDGSVVVLDRGVNSGYYRGTGGGLTPLVLFGSVSSGQYDDVFEALSVSRNGSIAYERYTTANPNPFEIHAIHAGVDHVVATIPLNNGAESIAINDSGRVAFTATFGATDAGLYLADENSLVKMATAAIGGPYAFIDYASINNHGDFAFLGTTPSGVIGVFTGSSPISSKVIGTGDPLDGSIVTDIRFGSYGLNDSGQIAFWAALANGHSGIYSASPVPEPASGIVLVLGGIALGVRRRAKSSSWRDS